jgi:LAO/AO transport system kinase
MGIAEVWEAVRRHREALAPRLAVLRAAQARKRMWTEVEESLVEALRRDAAVRRLLPEMERAVGDGQLAPSAAARTLVETFRAGQ